ncbi:uncharacterized protein LOC110102400 isoform X1 [Dendrobium catenatum]|uniref:Uncharacterized protein n=1 Tax=Dendrobium catenatum TaxID=906689 RepID=A0A2I0XFY6_9ASPA|nr:uncharacterized protein LOC110102400 isoform X1 [Dendrobium catenatum]PKU86827.1 hypothetical protein MA16_Dca022487 [Dendrobium catenatum]
MDRADSEIEGEPEGMGKSSWSAVVLRRSWWIGKRVTIAGAAITSAPVIIPPLFVLSTLGLAFSFPFGIYLAGYMCTGKIMSVLLPQPSLKEVDKESLESEDLIETGFDADQLDEMILDEEKWENTGIFEGERQEGFLSEFGNRNGVERPAVELGVEGEVEEVKTGNGIVEVDEMGKIVELGNDTAAVEKLRSNDFDYFAEVRKEVQLGEKVREQVTAPESSGSPKSPYTVAVMASNEESNNKGYEPPNLSSEHVSIVELRGEGKTNDTLVTKELREDGGEEEKILRVTNSVVAKDKKLLEECRTEVPRLKSDYELSAVIVPSKDEDFENFDKVDSMERRSLGRPVPAALVEVGVTGLHSHDDISSLQRTNNEEQHWDQIFSLRAIVGYNETLQPSLREEVMALYLYIGVEPPVSLKHATDIAEINKNLQFLKSVVGVK